MPHQPEAEGSTPSAGTSKRTAHPRAVRLLLLTQRNILFLMRPGAARVFHENKESRDLRLSAFCYT